MSTPWDNKSNYLLQQSQFFLLLQNYGKIVIKGLDFTSWIPRKTDGALQKEDAFYIRLEGGGKILISDPAT